MYLTKKQQRKGGEELSVTSDRIFSLLQERGIEQKEFARQIGVSDKTVSAWKTGRAKSFTKYLPKITKFLGITADELLKEEKQREEGKKWAKNQNFPYTVTVCGRLEYKYCTGADSVIGSCKIPPEYIQELEQLIEKMLKSPQNQY